MKFAKRIAWHKCDQSNSNEQKFQIFFSQFDAHRLKGI